MEQIEILLECLTTEEISILVDRVESISNLEKHDSKFDQILLALFKELSKRKNETTINKLNEDNNSKSVNKL